ncbi:MAG: hypothetical protein ACYDD5_00030 [Sulfuricurvum sp.]
MMTTRKAKDENGLSIYDRGGLKSSKTWQEVLPNGNTRATETSIKSAATMKIKDSNGLSIYDKSGAKVSATMKEKKLASGHRNPKAVKIEIYNEIGEIMFKCHGDFGLVCIVHGLPQRKLIKSRQLDGTPIFKSEDMNKVPDKFIEFIGWYAKDIS